MPSPPLDPQKRQADFQAFMKRGREAMAAGKYDDAVKALTEATRLMPADKDAAALLAQAQKRLPKKP
jgi:cytochrome c-type biogenesis protein CcmH/NrfG